MPRYFFDIVNGGLQRDDTGTECADLASVREAAMATLPAIAKDEIPAAGDHKSFSVVARDEQGEAVYAATLSYVGMWVARRETGGVKVAPSSAP
jgi:hypothetical protein